MYLCIIKYGNMKNEYCVYLHIKETDGSPFYVGKGLKSRSYQKTSRNKWWCSVVDKHNYDIIYLEENLTETQALEREVYWIKRIGRKSLGLGPLVNLTDGGEGTSGRIVSEVTRLKTSLSNKGQIYHGLNSGQKRSEATKLKISTAKKGCVGGRSLVVLDLATGIFYSSIKEAAIYNNFKPRTLEAQLSGQNPNTTTLVRV